MAAIPKTPAADRLFSAALLVLGIATAQAQVVRSGGEDAQAMQQVQALAAERAALRADNDKLKAQVAELQRKLDTATTERTALSARSKELQAQAVRGTQSSKQLSDEIAKSRAQMQELVARFRETALNLKTVESDRNTLRGQLATRDHEYETCVEHNVGLYDLGSNALDRLDRRGLWSRFKESEPFTQIARARLDNLIDDYRYRLDQLHIKDSKKTGAEKVP